MRRGDIVWALALSAVIALIVVPQTHGFIITQTKLHPCAMAFVKFYILASMGELLSLRLKLGDWVRPVGFGWRAVVWGVLGTVIALMFQIFNGGVQLAMSLGMLPGKGSPVETVAAAFWMSIMMNSTFAPVMMAAHRMVDAYIELVGGRIFSARASLDQVLEQINWKSFYSFVIAKTIPFFWVPAHTITFLVPPEYRVLLAAFLSIVLGALLAYGARLSSSRNALTVA